jgi:benzoate membrane transport protein
LGALFVVAPVAGVAAGIQSAVPDALLVGVAGLALVGVLAQSLGEITRGPLRLGSLFAIAVTSSSMHLAGFGAALWALVIGMLVTLSLEGQEYAALVACTASSHACRFGGWLADASPNARRAYWVRRCP